jgi:gliding motility-associated-like protein
MTTLKRLISSIVLVAIAFAAASQDYSYIEFIENKGQWDRRVKFKGEVSNGAVFLRDGGFTILQHNPQDYALVQKMAHDQNSMAGAGQLRADGSFTMRSHAYNVDFVGASPKMQVLSDKGEDSYNNYLIGDPSKWATGCRIFRGVTLKEIYPNVDVRYYTDNGKLKYDIIAKPGADISKIALKYEGVDRLEVKNRELIVGTSVGELRETYPYTYQTLEKGRKQLNARYVVKDNIVRFDIKDYDKNTTVVIDPTLVFCSLSNSTANNWGFTATYGPDGSFFGGGIVFSGNSFPTDVGSFQSTFQGGPASGGHDIGIIKLSANGANKLYATYLGGSGNEQPHSLISDGQGNLIIAGRTNSPIRDAGAFPVTGGAAGIIGPCGASDIIVTILNANGSGLINSRRIGGSGNDGINIKEGRSGQQSLEQNYGDDGRSEVILDGAGNIYVASCTQSSSANATEKFPVTAGAFEQNFRGGLQDAVVLKFGPNLSSLLFASFFGGGGNDAAYVISLSPLTNDIYIGGGTEGGLPNTAGTMNPTAPGSIDGFVAQISNDGSTLIRSTYLGTSTIDQVYGLKFDRLGFPYVTGQTRSGSWPVTPAGIYANMGAKQFIAKLRPDLSGFVYSTVFGNPSVSLPNISITAFLVDRCENVYVSGWGGETVPPPSQYATSGTVGMPTTADALNSPPGGTDGKDFYFFVLKKDGVSQLFGSYFGQAGGFTDHVDGGTSRFDENGVIYQAMCSNCSDGSVRPPTTRGVYGEVKPGDSRNCNLGMVKISFNLAGVSSDIQSAINGVPGDTSGCVPLTVTFTDQVRNGTQYIWNFGDGTGNFGPMAADTGYTRQHTYMAVGTYRVMLIAIDPASCNVQDTSYVNIRVGDQRANLNANYAKTGDCNSITYQFNNLSTTSNPARPFTDTSFIWDFGDGSPRVVAGLNSVVHTFPAPGPYRVRLILNDTAYCNNPDSLEIAVNAAANVDAQFTTPPVGCAPYEAVFSNTSIGGLTWQWDFGDPTSPDNTSTLSSPTHLYANPGTYTVKLIATDPFTCNIVDSASFTIVVFEKPQAEFSFTPVPPVVNTPNTFTNLSSPNSTRFKWIWGDGDTLATTSRADVQHQYNSTGTFNACLIAINDAGCADTICHPVSAIIEPLLDVPNAFTPNSNDINSVVMVRGFGISKIRFTIYNRWGQKVFETANRLQGWDGKVKGVVQPMDVYAYTLEAEFFDGTKATKKGDITLIR